MNFVKRFLVLYVLFTLLLFASGCSANWATEAGNIIRVLIPAVAALLATLTQIGVPVAVATAFQAWSGVAEKGLTEVQSLIAAYNAAEATAQPGIIGQIDSALDAILSQFNQILATVHVTDAKTQALWTQLATDFADEVEALLNLIPVVKGEITAHDEVVARVSKLKSAKTFKKEFNEHLAAGGWSEHKIA